MSRGLTALLWLGISLFLVSTVAAAGVPFTKLTGVPADPANRVDYVRNGNFTNENISASCIDLSGDQRCSWPAGGGGNSSVSGNGSANRLAIWSATDILTSNAALSFVNLALIIQGRLNLTGSVNASAVYVNGVDVCLANGTNCLSASESDPVWNGNASRVTNLETANTTLNTSVTNLITAVANLQTANGTLNDSVVSLIQRIADLNASTISNDSSQIALINALQGNVTLLFTNASGQQTVINNLVLESASLWLNASNQAVLINALQVAVTNLQTGNGTMNESIGILNSAVVDLRTANATINASVTTLLTTITTKANLTDCTGGNSTHANVSNSTRGTCILVSRNPGGGSGGTDINGSDVWLDDLNVTNLYANVEDGGVNYSIAVNAQGVTLTDTNAQSTFVGSSQIETTGQLAGGSLAIADGTWSYFESSTVDGVGYSTFNTDGGNNFLFSIEGSNGVNPGYPTFSVDSRTNTTTAERLRVNTTLNVTTEIYVGGAIVCRSDGTNCPAYALNTHVADVNTTANIQRLGFNTTTQLNVVYVRNASIPTCSGTDKLTSAGNGVFTCATDQTGGGGGLTNTSDAYFGTLNSTKNLTAGEDLILLEQNNAIYFGAEKCVWMNGTNTVLGCSATLQNISATGTTVVGDLAGSAITSGSNNVAIGYGAMIAGKTSSDNVALGTFSLFRTVDGGNYNFALGRSSGASITTGDSNICIGFSACQNTGNKGNQYNITDGGQNIFIGTLAGPGDLGGNAQNRVAIGYQAECNRNDSVCLGMATTRQNVGINTDRPEYTLDVNGTLAVNGVHVTGSWTNYTTIKQNVFGTTLANITGLAWGAAANTNYTFDCDLFYMSNLTTNGISFAMEDWDGTVTWFEVATEIHTVAAATVNSATANTTGTKMTSTAVTAANTKYRASLDGIIINGASAVTITPQFSAEIAGSNSSIMRGSHCDVKVI